MAVTAVMAMGVIRVADGASASRMLRQRTATNGICNMTTRIANVAQRNSRVENAERSWRVSI